MKQLTTLIALLLLAPALAIAEGTVNLGFVTSGSATLTNNASLGVQQVEWVGSGSGFSIDSGGSFCCEFTLFAPIENPFPAGSTNVSISLPNDTLDATLFINSFTVGGVQIAIGPPGGPGSADAMFGALAAGPITHTGTYPASFGFEEHILSLAGTSYEFQGSGTGVFDVAPFPGSGCPGCFYVNTATFTFVPEPSTESLLLLALTGLAVLGRRRSRVTLLPAG